MKKWGIKLKKMKSRSYFAVLFFTLVIFNYMINKYNFFTVIKDALSPVTTGFVIAYLLDPLVKYIVLKLKIKRGFSIFLTIVIILGFLVLFGAILVPSIINSAIDIVEKINYYFEYQFDIKIFERLLTTVNNDIVAEIVKYVNDSLKEILVKVGELSTLLLNGLVSFVLSTSSSLLNLFMAFIISIYMLVDKSDLLTRIKRLNYAVNDEHVADVLYEVVKKSDEVFSSFFIGKIIDSAIIGTLCFVILWIFKIPNSPAIGFVIGLTNIIPYFGPFIGAIPSLLVTLASGTLFQVMLVAIIIVVLQQFDGLYLGPKILGGKVGVGAFWIIVSVSVGGSLFGIVGMFVGVPVVVIIKTLIEELVSIKLKDKKIDV